MILVTGPSDLAGDSSLTSLHAPGSGRLVVSAPIDSVTAGAAMRALLRAMGKRPSVAPVWERTADELPWARIWLEAFRLRIVIMHQVGRLPAQVIGEVDDVVRDSGGTFYGIADPLLIPGLVARLGDRVEERLDFSVLVERWHGAAIKRAPRMVSRLDNAPAARRLVAKIKAGPDRRSTAYLVGLTEAAGFPRPGQPTATLLACRLRAVLERFSDPVCQANAVHGAAIAQRPFGWEIGLDPIRLAEGPDERPILGLTAPSLRAFRIFRDPLPGAVWSLTRLPITLDELLSIQVGDVTPTGRMVSIGGEWYQLPADARPLVRAQLIARRLEGAEPSDLLLMRPGGRGRTHAWIVALASAAAAEVGVRFLDDELRHRPSAHERWLHERGITLTWIARTERPSIGLALVDLERTARDTLSALGQYDRVPDCSCPEPHMPMDASQFTGWPPRPKRAHVAFDTGARRNAYGPSRYRSAWNRGP